VTVSASFQIRALGIAASGAEIAQHVCTSFLAFALMPKVYHIPKSCARFAFLPPKRLYFPKRCGILFHACLCRLFHGNITTRFEERRVFRKRVGIACPLFRTAPGVSPELVFAVAKLCGLKAQAIVIRSFSLHFSFSSGKTVG
jgi:hypothetical protein